MLSQFCVQTVKRPRGPCCRSFVFVLKMRSNKTEKTERAMLSQFVFVLKRNNKLKTERAMLSQCCVRSANERQHTVKTERAMLSQFCGRSENEKQKLKRPRGHAVAVLCSF